MKKEETENRRCIVTRERKDKADLLRFTMVDEGLIVPDLGKKLAGRGVFVSNSKRLVAEAVRKKCFIRATKGEGYPCPNLVEVVEALLKKRGLDMINLARKAGCVVCGFEKVKEAEIKAAQEVAKNKEKDELEEKHKKEIEEYQKIIDQLKRNKSSLNSKNIGEDLENWCDHEVRQYMQNGLLNCTWEKDNKVIKNEDENKGSKADFIFKIYADEKKEKETLLTSVCLEMKDENPDSVNKKTNKDYYNQLDKNRIKKECRYAVLVSDLERDKPNDLSIYKVLEYQDMYVVRPEYMMTFLNMLVSLNTTFAKLTLLKSREDEKFKSYDELQEEFEKIKKSYLDDQLSKLENEVINLEKHNKTISDASLKINESIRKIRDNYIDQIKDKLEKFEIKISKQYKRTFKD